MDVCYSAAQRGFFSPQVHGDNMPPDCVPISEELHAELLMGEASGKLIEPDADGRPQLADPPPPSPELQRRQLAAVAQRHLDDVARAWGYDSLAEAVTYADEDAVPAYKAEGRLLRTWRSLVWQMVDGMLASGLPTAGELIDALPAAPVKP